MSDPQPAPGKSKPPRAEPLQPDLPGRGDETGSNQEVDIDRQGAMPNQTNQSAKESAERQKEQSDAALGNVRKGYE